MLIYFKVPVPKTGSEGSAAACSASNLSFKEGNSTLARTGSKNIVVATNALTGFGLLEQTAWIRSAVHLMGPSDPHPWLGWYLISC